MFASTSQPHLDELESMMEQHVLLDECSQPIFKKLISDQIMMIRRNGHEKHDARMSSSISLSWNNSSMHAPEAAEVAEWGAVEPVADWNSNLEGELATSAATWEAPAAEWGTAVEDWGRAAEWECENWGGDNVDWSSSASEWDSVNQPTLGVEYVAEVAYDSNLQYMLPSGLIGSGTFNRMTRKLGLKQVKEKIHLTFDEIIDPTKDSWAQVKSPGCYQIGVFNLYMKDYLYFDSNKSEFILSETERNDHGLRKLATPLQNHPPVGQCTLTEGCSFRPIKDETLEKYKDVLAKTKLRTDIINNWKIYNMTNVNNSYNDCKGYTNNGRMILDYFDNLSEMLDFDIPYGDDELNCYMDGAKNSDGSWGGYVYGHNKHRCMIIGTFTMKKL